MDNEIINNSENNILPAKKIGRPKGSKNKVKTNRPDKSVAMAPHTEPGENSRYLYHDMKLMSLPTIDINNNEQVKTRIKEYFQICIDDDIKPSIASLALSFGISRITLFKWLTEQSNAIKNQECRNTIKSAYNNINSYYEHLMNNGKINPVAGIFLLKNNLGYQDTTNYVISADNKADLSLSDIEDRAGLLSDDTIP